MDRRDFIKGMTALVAIAPGVAATLGKKFQSHGLIVHGSAPPQELYFAGQPPEDESGEVVMLVANLDTGTVYSLNMDYFVVREMDTMPDIFLSKKDA